MGEPATIDDERLIGRDLEVAAIGRALAGLASGSGRLLMLTGEPGIGKSTLARAAAQRAAREGIPAYWGFAWEAGGAPAYWPWTQLLGSLVGEQAPPPASTAGLQQLLPGVADESTGDATPPVQPAQARFRLLESVRRLLDEVSRSTPLVLILEDLHAADADSLHLLHHVARHLSGMPLCVIGTFRDLEARAMSAGDPLWRSCRDAEVLRLRRLDENEVRDFLSVRRPAPASERQVRSLLSASDGNPLFLSELVGLLAQQGSDDIRLPASVQQVIRQQIALLPAAPAALLADASVLGREFDQASLAAISGRPVDDVAALLQVAQDAGLLRRTPEGRMRFVHTLHRDVLYQDLDAVRRSLLHERYATHIRQFIAGGDEDRWVELANHLKAAGHRHRAAAIDAWRHAARRASGRLAFEDAAALLRKALSAFGEGPRSTPAERYRLLLECAEATLLCGDVETGQRHCRDAFAIARTLEDATLMAEAALAWGGVIVVARVDADLVAALRASLAALPQKDAGMRSRVLARLAGALQPAPNPAEPMDMAREAIRLARTADDERVMYNVLGSAISALMDFAPADERLALNEEFGALAEKFGDVPGQFRSKLRLMIDACEVADRLRMDRAIDECRRLAERIGLPHYLWRAASARAMQAIVEGDFAAATALLDEAQSQAERIDDLEARITLPLQRFAILVEWDSDRCTPFQEIDAGLQVAYRSGMREVEFFAGPFINAYRQPLDRDVARTLLGDRQAVERAFAGADRYSMGRLGEIAVVAGDTEFAKRAFNANLRFVDHCATLGLMGSSAVGPNAWMLGKVAAGLGRVDEALRLLDKALVIAESMRAPVWKARIHADIAELERQAGNTASSGKHAAEATRLRRQLQLRARSGVPQETAGTEGATTRDAGLRMRRDGELWQVSFGGRQLGLRRTRGLDMLARLIATPDRDIHVLDLAGTGSVRDQGSPGAALDAKARADYERRVRELRDELAEAEEFGDIGRAEAARAEIDFIGRELARAFGLGGRARPGRDDAERARVNVRRRIKDAIERVAKLDEEAGRYLENTIKTGTYCRYAPV